MIGILRWIVELGRIDIYVEVSMLASCIALRRVEYLNEVCNIFAYLKCHDKAEIVFDPSELDIDIYTKFPKQDWSDIVYGDCEKELPYNMAEERGLGFKIVVSKITY